MYFGDSAKIHIIFCSLARKMLGEVVQDKAIQSLEFYLSYSNHLKMVPKFPVGSYTQEVHRPNFGHY